MSKIIFPPRPKGKMPHNDLGHYESTGRWVAQRKFRGSRAVVYIDKDRNVVLGSRHGREFAKFTLSEDFRSELLSSLRLEDGKAYWLDGELMNKDVDATNEIIFFDVLQAGRYMFGFPDQIRRLECLREICGNPAKLCPSGIALEVSPRVWMAETFDSNFNERFKEAINVDQLEGLVLRKKSACLDAYGDKEYETTNLIRCRKPFSKDKGYEF
jgi:ATP-dependent DNA ligase